MRTQCLLEVDVSEEDTESRRPNTGHAAVCSVHRAPLRRLPQLPLQGQEKSHWPWGQREMETCPLGESVNVGGACHTPTQGPLKTNSLVSSALCVLTSKLQLSRCLVTTSTGKSSWCHTRQLNSWYRSPKFSSPSLSRLRTWRMLPGADPRARARLQEVYLGEGTQGTIVKDWGESNGKREIPSKGVRLSCLLPGLPGGSLSGEGVLSRECACYPPVPNHHWSRVAPVLGTSWIRSASTGPRMPGAERAADAKFREARGEALLAPGSQLP